MDQIDTLLDLTISNDDREKAANDLIIEHNLNLSTEQILNAFLSIGLTRVVIDENIKQSVNKSLKKILEVSQDMFIAIILSLNATSIGRMIVNKHVLDRLLFFNLSTYDYVPIKEPLPKAKKFNLKNAVMYFMEGKFYIINDVTKVNAYGILLEYYYFDVSNFNLQDESKATLIKYSKKLNFGKLTKKSI